MPDTARVLHEEMREEMLRRSSGDGWVRAPAQPVDRLNAAVVHDWLPVYAGAERVLEQILSVLPGSQLYSLIDYLPEEQRAFLQGKEVHTSFIQKLPFSKSKYRYYLPFAPMAIEQFDLTDYEVVISSSYAVAKGVLTNAEQFHVSYTHSPIRYAWDLHFQYLRQSNMQRGLRGAMARLLLHYVRLFDASSTNRVDLFIANSQNVARRIWSTYRRRAAVVYPPVDTEAFTLHEKKDNYYLTMSRMVPYKRIDLIVEAFAEMPDRELLVIGDGPEMKRIKAKAGPNVTMLGYQPFEAVKYYMQRACAFVFAAEEDFGIVPVEAQACGTPVIAYGRGGALETVVPGETGIFFDKQDPEALRQAVRMFEFARHEMEPARIRQQAERFSIDRFRQEFYDQVERAHQRYVAGGRCLNDEQLLGIKEY